MPRITYQRNSSSAMEAHLVSVGDTLGLFLERDNINLEKVRILVNGIETTNLSYQLEAGDEVVLQARNLNSGKRAA